MRKLSDDLDFNVSLCSLLCLWCRQQHLECTATPAGLLALLLCMLTDVDSGAYEGMAGASLLGETMLLTTGILYLKSKMGNDKCGIHTVNASKSVYPSYYGSSLVEMFCSSRYHSRSSSSRCQAPLLAVELLVKSRVEYNDKSGIHTAKCLKICLSI